MIKVIEELKKKLEILSEQCTNFVKAMDSLALIKFDITEIRLLGSCRTSKR